ncbi:hypothetical protein ACIVBQ_000548 [Tenacibaculum discolor]
MSDKVITKKEKDDKSNSGFGGLLLTVGISSYFGYKSYKTFIGFIDSLQLGIRVNDINKGKAHVNLMPLNCLNVPYKIQNLSVLNNEGKIIIASSLHCDTNKRIVANSHIPIIFNLVKPVENFEGIKVAITYCFWGMSFKRLYTPIEKELVNSGGDVYTSKKCGCNK